MKTVLVTGGTKGIGLAVAKVMAPLASKIVLTYNSDKERAEKVSVDLKVEFDHLQEVYVWPSDITKAGTSKALAERLKKEDLVPDVMVLNAGTTIRDSFWDLTEEQWDKVMRGNLIYNIMLVRYMGEAMKKGSSIIVTGSLMGIHPHSVSVPYGVSKSSLHAFVKNMTKVLSPLGIRINGVAPGFVDTEWQKTKPKEIRASIESKIALGKFAPPEVIADVYKMLVEIPYFNGQIIVADGGYSYR